MTSIALPSRGVSLRPLALPNEHGGWGFLLEPIALGLLVAPSWSGALVALAALFGFLVRHPLKLALQDTLRERSVPRTRWCWLLVVSYLSAATLALAAAVALRDIRILIPLGLVAPMALTQVLYDAHNRSRELFPELSGAAAMSSIAAAVALAGGTRLLPALGLAGIGVARTLPSIVYVRTLLRPASIWPALVLHVLAFGAVAWLTRSPFVMAAMVILLVRSVWGLTHEPPRAKTIGWREIVFGAVTVGLVAVGW